MVLVHVLQAGLGVPRRGTRLRVAHLAAERAGPVLVARAGHPSRRHAVRRRSVPVVEEPLLAGRVGLDVPDAVPVLRRARSRASRSGARGCARRSRRNAGRRRSPSAFLLVVAARVHHRTPPGVNATTPRRARPDECACSIPSASRSGAARPAGRPPRASWRDRRSTAREFRRADDAGRRRRAVLGGRCGHRLRTHDLAQFLDGTTRGVDLALERGEPVGRLGRVACLRGELRVTALEETDGVALFGDVTTEQLPRLDVDGVVAEEACRRRRACPERLRSPADRATRPSRGRSGRNRRSPCARRTRDRQWSATRSQAR